MKNKILFLFMVLTLVTSLVMAGCAAPAPAPTPAPTPAPAKPEEGPILWRLNTWQPGNRIDVILMQDAANEIYERSDGRLEIEIYPAFSLGLSPTTWLRDLKDGVIDISCVYPAYAAGEEPSFSITELPHGIWISDQQSVGAMDALFNFKKRVYKDVWSSELIASSAIPDGNDSFIFTTKKQTTTLDDLVGLKIRTPGGRYKELYALMGVAPQMMPLSDVYMAGKTGVIDGYFTGCINVLDMKLYEFTKYGLSVGASEALAQDMVISDKAWEALSSDVQEIVRYEFEKWAGANKGLRIHGVLDAYTIGECEAKGLVFTYLSEEEMVTWRETGLKVALDWIEATGGRTAEAWEIIKPMVIPVTRAELVEKIGE